MTRITRIILGALATLAIVAPAATAMPSDPSVRPQTGTATLVQSGATDTPSACASGSRAVQGPAGTGCTTSPSDNSDELVMFGILAGSGAFAIALGAGAAAARRRDRAATTAAFSQRTS